VLDDVDKSLFGNVRTCSIAIAVFPKRRNYFTGAQTDKEIVRFVRKIPVPDHDQSAKFQRLQLDFNFSGLIQNIKNGQKSMFSNV
jgi:hypothetical protein